MVNEGTVNTKHGPILFSWRLVLHVSMCVWLCTSSLVPSASFAAAPNKKFQWVLVQNGIEESGHVVTVSHDAVSVVSQKYGYHVVAAAPTWVVHCFRPNEKIEWVTKLETFNGHRLFSPFAVGTANTTQMNFYGKGKFLGLKVTKYSEVSSPKSLSYLADEIPVTPKVAEFLCRYYDVPEMEKIPLFHCVDKGYAPPKPRKGDQWSFDEIAKDLRQGTVVDLTTISCKKVPYNSSEFEYPQGFRKVTSPGQAAYSSGQKEMFTDFLDDVGLSTEQKERKSHGAKTRKAAPAQERH